jgi:hypothetical protein
MVIAAEVPQYLLHRGEAGDGMTAVYYQDDGSHFSFGLERLDASDVFEADLAGTAAEWFRKYRKASDGTIHEVVAVGIDEAYDEQYLICAPMGRTKGAWRCLSVKEFERLSELVL